MKDENNSTTYFAAREKEECVSAIIKKIEDWEHVMDSCGYYDKLKDMYAAYHGVGFGGSSIGDAHQINFSGDNEELVELGVNHLRNIGEHMLNMVTTTRPAMRAKSSNTDSKSIAQTNLANSLIEYYMREEKIERKLRDTCEYAISLAGGWIKLSWNSTIGEISNKKEIEEIKKDIEDAKKRGEKIEVEVPKEERSGEIECQVKSQLDVILDLTKENIYDHEWKICRSFKNRFDLIAKYPEFKEEILKIESKSEKDISKYGSFFRSETDDIPIFEFYHEKTEAVPEGRYILFAAEKCIFYDGVLPYRRIPLFPLFPSHILGTSLGYTSLFDLLPIQDSLNCLYSIVLSNQNATGVQTILNPTGNNIDVSQLTQGLSIINYIPGANGGKPESLNLTNTPKEIFTMIEMLVRAEETLSGMNPVVRGDPQASLRSGAALGVIQANAIQFISGLQQNYIYLLEDVGMALIEMLVDYAQSPRIAEIVGESGKSYIREFKGEDLSNINRVVVEVVNPLTTTLAGRAEMAANLLQYSAGQFSPEDYYNVLNTGNLRTMTEDFESQEILIKSENEGLMRGEPQIVIDTDLHLRHITKHSGILNHITLRKDAQLVKVTLDHINAHLEALRTTDPQLLAALKQQSLNPNNPPAEGGMNPTMLQGPEATGEPQPGAQGSPDFMQMPAGMENAPLTPLQNMQSRGMI